MDKGALVPDSVTVGIVKERLAQDDCKKGWILDGFPRTTAQASALDAILHELGIQLTAVIGIKANRDDIIKRVSGRLVCKKCGASFHKEFRPPKTPGICDNCGGELYQRLMITKRPSPSVWMFTKHPQNRSLTTTRSAAGTMKSTETSPWTRCMLISRMH